jgi:zinc/manganese transport system permease protein
MFAPFMQDTWITASVVAVVAALVGFFVGAARRRVHRARRAQRRLRRSRRGQPDRRQHHLGLGVFSLGGALLIGLLSRRGRHDAVTALTVALMLGLGALFLSWSTEYAAGDLLAAVRRGARRQPGTRPAARSSLASSAIAIAVLYRPLLLSSTLPEVAEARGISTLRIEMLFLILVALATDHRGGRSSARC